MQRRDERRDSHSDDHAELKAIIAGDTAAWQAFVHGYSGLIFGVIKRHLPGETYDVQREVYVDTLEFLYKGGLAKYDPCGSFVSWLIVVTRRRAYDTLRARRGRVREPAGLADLTVFERKVFQLVYVERLGLSAVVHALSAAGHKVHLADVVAAIESIEETIDRRVLDRIDAHAGRFSGDRDSERFLRYVVAARAEYEARFDESTVDRAAAKTEARELSESVRLLLDTLSDEERAVIDLRFGEQLKAHEIAQRLSLRGQRRVYTIVDRVIRKLRAALEL